MQPALRLLEDLNDSDAAWLFSAGSEQQYISGSVIVREGQPAESLFIVLDGLLSVRIAALEDREIATLGPGEIAGDISFLEGQNPAASVAALETSLLLVLPRNVLDEKLESDSAFAARFYRALAVINSRRLRQQVGDIGRALTSAISQKSLTAGRQTELLNSVDEFKKLLSEADSEAIKHDGVLPESCATAIDSAFQQLCRLAHECIGAAENELLKEALGNRLQREFLPYLLLTRTAERFYSKPRGYAGDFLTIDIMYANQPVGTGRLGAALDAAFLNTRASKAVRNRRALLTEEIAAVLNAAKESANITSLACGPAAELFDAFQGLDNRRRLKASLIDIDMQALAFVADKRDKAGLQNQMALFPGNLVYLALGKQKLDLPPQDLIYSIGLIDYFNDKFVIKLLNWIHSRLRVGGKVILGNFHPCNTDKVLMDYLLDWKLIHRSQDDMNRLFSASMFGQPCTNIRFEPEGINMFASAIKS